MNQIIKDIDTHVFARVRETESNLECFRQNFSRATDEILRLENTVKELRKKLRKYEENKDDELDDEFLNEINNASLSDRLKLLLKMIEDSISTDDYDESHIEMHVMKIDQFNIALNYLRNMSENDGKIII
jgi:predicted nuclease with TOPRIM domain